MEPTEIASDIGEQAQFAPVVGVAKAVESASTQWQQFLSLGLRNPSRDVSSYSVQKENGGGYTDVVKLSDVPRPQFTTLISRFSKKASTNLGLESESAETGLFASKNLSRKTVQRLRPGEVERIVTQALQRFECYVEEIKQEVITARLIDKTGNKPTLIADVLREEIPEADQDVLDVGAVFYWSIGYSFETGGTKRRFSEIRFRRSPRWNNAFQSSADKFVELFSDFLTDNTDAPNNGAGR